MEEEGRGFWHELGAVKVKIDKDVSSSLEGEGN